MATRSTIALQYANGVVDQVYCHWDGYLNGVGEDLLRGYTDPFELRKLIDGGDMSTIGEPYTARGDAYEDCAPRRFSSFNDYVRRCQQEEYDYILRPVDGKAVWFVRCSATDGEWVTLQEAAQAEAREEV